MCDINGVGDGQLTYRQRILLLYELIICFRVLGTTIWKQKYFHAGLPLVVYEQCCVIRGTVARYPRRHPDVWIWLS